MIKKVNGSLYVHKSNVVELMNNIKDRDLRLFTGELICIYNREYETSKLKSNKTDMQKWEYEVIKVDTINKTVSMINSYNWDISFEPDVGNSDCWKLDTCSYVKIKPKGQVYHHKWMFVSDDYTGFDIEAAKKRTEIIMALPGYKENINKIGYKKFWVRFCNEHGVEV